MLLEIHVKNFALFEKADIFFKNGFNVITGETGAGKSILIDSINICLGAKAGKSVIRTGKDVAYIELVFEISDRKKIEDIEKEGFTVEDNIIVITRQISEKRSIIRVNDELVSSKRLQILASKLIDIHGQHDNLVLMDKSLQADLLDRFAGKESEELLYKLKDNYSKYKELKDILDKDGDKYIREREIDILSHEINEIESVRLKPGESDKLKKIYKLLSGKDKVYKSLEKGLDLLSQCDFGVIVRELEDFASFDSGISQITSQIKDSENLIEDIKRNINDYIDNCDNDEENLHKVEKRLDIINKIENKYGGSYEHIEKILNEKKKRLQEIKNYEENLSYNKERILYVENLHIELSKQLSSVRKKYARILSDAIKEQLKSLSFLNSEFEITVESANIISEKGYDKIDFLISTNIGEPLKPVADVASGGELSRIMLAVKSIMSSYEDVDTMIFDEIDTGISGNTAISVAKRLAYIGKKRQVICISHLAQIACMADNNFLIKKIVKDNKTLTNIENIEGDKLEDEIVRLIGATSNSDNVIETVREMLNMKYNTEFNL